MFKLWQLKTTLPRTKKIKYQEDKLIKTMEYSIQLLLTWQFLLCTQTDGVSLSRY